MKQIQIQIQKMMIEINSPFKIKQKNNQVFRVSMHYKMKSKKLVFKYQKITLKRINVKTL